MALVQVGLKEATICSPITSTNMLGLLDDSRTWRFAFFFTAAVILVLALMPNTVPLPSTGWDKTNHLLWARGMAVASAHRAAVARRLRRVDRGAAVVHAESLGRGVRRGGRRHGHHRRAPYRRDAKPVASLGSLTPMSWSTPWLAASWGVRGRGLEPFLPKRPRCQCQVGGTKSRRRALGRIRDLNATRLPPS